MAHLFEEAPTGRSKCRGCGQAIAKAELRFGERLPNPFAEGEMTHWFHPVCAAYKRPEPMLESLELAPPELRERLESAARGSLAQPRLPRIDGAELAPGSQASCRQCREKIAKGEWRLRLVFHEEGVFSPAGYIHLGCRKAYFETDDILAQVMHFSPALDAEARAALAAAFGAP
jgi:hypothetical protein